LDCEKNIFAAKMKFEGQTSVFVPGSSRCGSKRFVRIGKETTVGFSGERQGASHRTPDSGGKYLRPVLGFGAGKAWWVDSAALLDLRQRESLRQTLGLEQFTPNGESERHIVDLSEGCHPAGMPQRVPIRVKGVQPLTD
jgi:hypothetical protein